MIFMTFDLHLGAVWGLLVHFWSPGSHPGARAATSRLVQALRAEQQACAGPVRGPAGNRSSSNPLAPKRRRRNLLIDISCRFQSLCKMIEYNEKHVLYMFLYTKIQQKKIYPSLLPPNALNMFLDIKAY